jgi:NADPH:quinone reductase-like Zn-dependent oxidoreductase
MKAIVQHRYGAPDVLALEEAGKPAAGEADVLIRVHAAGISYPDGLMIRGVPYILPSRRTPAAPARCPGHGGGRDGHRSRRAGHRFAPRR